MQLIRHLRRLPRRGRLPFLLLPALLLSCGFFPTEQAAINTSPHTVAPPTVAGTLGGQTSATAAYMRLPLAFEANHGQADPAVRFLAHGPGYTLLCTPAAFLALSPATAPASLPTALRFAFVGANPQPGIGGASPLPGIANYFIGSDPATWETNIPTSAEVRYTDLYPGIDLTIYGTQGGQWEYDVLVAPRANPDKFAITIGDGAGTRLDTDGALVIATPNGEVRQRAPVLYQDANGERRSVGGGYDLRADGTVGFRVGEYDRSLPLVIDPSLVYSTYVGGTGFDYADGIAADRVGNTYITGYTNDSFPAVTGQVVYGGGFSDAFVAKMNATGTALLYSTYLGGSGDDRGYGIAVDAAGNAYVAGATNGSFPTTAGAYQTTYGGSFEDAFVTKLNATGTGLLYSTYLGGSSVDYGYAIAVDGAGDAFVTGQTNSTDFSHTAGVAQATIGGGTDAYATKLNATGTGLLYSTFIGGGGQDFGYGIAVDGVGNAYVAGTTDGNFPTTGGAYRTTYAGGFTDAFVTKVNATGTARLYSTYLGGPSDDSAAAIAIDSAGSVYVTGSTAGSFPTTPGAFQTAYGGGPHDAYATALNAAGAALIYSTYLGGGVDDDGYAIAVDGGIAFITGRTYSPDFPTTPGAVGTALSGGADAFVTVLNGSGTTPVYSTYLGGTNDDDGYAIAVDAAGNTYVAGGTLSRNFPTTPGVYQSTYGGGSKDAFIAKFAVIAVATLPTGKPSAPIPGAMPAPLPPGPGGGGNVPAPLPPPRP
ncbi:MAG: SBBP repeat-containing protein [Thermomicrobiales bacterium]